MTGTKTILVTGAASGIGKATARLFARNGWFVGLFDVNETGLADLHRELGQDRSCFRVMDVTNADDVREAAAFFAAKTGNRIDLLFNCAGVLFMGPHHGIDIGLQKKTVDINVTGILNCIDACFPYLKDTPGAAVISMSSASAVYGTPELAVYSATKHAVRGLTEALNIEFEPHDIHVGDVMAPYVRTPMILEAGTRAVSVSRLNVTITPETVAASVWKAFHRRKIHWNVGAMLMLLQAVCTLAPFVRRPLVKALAFSGK